MSKNENKNSGLSRRKFISNTAIVTAGISIVPRSVLGGIGYTAPSDKLNIAGIGIGGMGRSNLRNIEDQNIVALCDVDWKYAERTFNDYSKAKKYKDYRIMMDEMDTDIDAVVIATPDHTHTSAAALCMRQGKHVYLQKPLALSVAESRFLTGLADETGVATQMGNQGRSTEGMRLFAEWFWNGEIGEVKEAHAWTNRPIWPQGLERPNASPAVPDTLSWDLFLGTAPSRPYNPAYTPWNWRAWWDFGTGALGDMGCHIIDPLYLALDLGHPTAFEGSSSLLNTESAPISETVTYYFPERGKKHNVNLPSVIVKWYDGGLMPERPEGMEPGRIMGDGGGGAMLVGTKGTMICSTYGKDPYIIGREDNPPKAPKRMRRVETNHEMDWVRAAKEPQQTRVKASAHFGSAGPLNEIVVMGNLPIRLQDLKKKLEWDGEAMEITNIGPSEEIRVVTSDKFDVVDGDPKFDTQYVTMNAKEASQQYIKPVYRDGWKLKGY